MKANNSVTGAHQADNEAHLLCVENHLLCFIAARQPFLGDDRNVDRNGNIAEVCQSTGIVSSTISLSCVLSLWPDCLVANDIPNEPGRDSNPLSIVLRFVVLNQEDAPDLLGFLHQGKCI